MLKNITSKNETRNQLLNTENRDMKTRTRLRKKLQIEKRSAHEDAMEIVMIDDALSEETVHTSKDQYCADIERFVDILGVARSIPEAFCTNKQVNSDDGSTSRTLQEEEVHIREEDLEISPELSQCRKSLQTYKEQTRYLQDKRKIDGSQQETS